MLTFFSTPDPRRSSLRVSRFANPGGGGRAHLQIVIAASLTSSLPTRKTGTAAAAGGAAEEAISRAAPQTPKPSVGELDTLLGALEKAYAAGTPMPTSLEDLKRDYSVSAALLEALERLVLNCAEHTEARCIAAFLVLLARHSRRREDPRFLQHLNTQFSLGRDTRVLRQRIIKEILP